MFNPENSSSKVGKTANGTRTKASDASEKARSGQVSVKEV